ncbi:unnamed protein product [Calicophoron daubneyi]|uniref:Major facilitator superfamily domain-containing protein 12 n=1 Tax=Calicophoron daubneyi TaxID=300641 RepID=A0AAV2TJB6_CALDB
MKWITKISYGAGQTQKDLVGGVINIFILLYLEHCLKIGSAQVGTLLLLGQIVNAVSTPLIGFISDRAVQNEVGKNVRPDALRELRQSWLCRCKDTLSLGKRKALHLQGSLAMTICLPLLFGQPRSISYLPLWSKMIISGVLLMFIQLGWAAVQIAHLTLLNYLTDKSSERVVLVSLRYLFGSIADISTFLLSFLFLSESFSVMKPEENRGDQNFPTRNNTNKPLPDGTEGVQPIGMGTITVEDMPLIRNITLILVAYGLLFVILFQCFVPEKVQWIRGDGESTSNAAEGPNGVSVYVAQHPEKPSSTTNKIRQIDSSNFPNVVPPADTVRSTQDETKSPEIFQWYDWFARPRFWVCCCIFSSVRVGVALAMIYLSPFLLNELKMKKSSIALVPLATFVCCLLATLIQGKIAKWLGHLANFAIGITCTLTYCVLVFFYEVGTTSEAMVYCAAALLGVGNAFNYVMAIVVISDIIGTTHVNTAAFVQGFASLLDKIFQGIFIQIIQITVPYLSHRHVESFVVGGLMLLAGICALIDWFFWGSKGLQEAGEVNSSSVIPE